MKLEHPTLIRPEEHATYDPRHMGKTTLFQSPNLLVGLNAFEAGREHALHTHAGMDKVYLVLQGRGLFLLEDREVEMQTGELLVAPADTPHGVRNTSDERLLVLVVLSPPPQVKTAER